MSIMRKSTAEKIVQKLQDAGYRASVYENYSGRGMYGRTVMGIDTDADPVSFKRISKRAMRSDNLGMGYIYY